MPNSLHAVRFERACVRLSGYFPHQSLVTIASAGYDLPTVFDHLREVVFKRLKVQRDDGIKYVPNNAYRETVGSYVRVYSLLDPSMRGERGASLLRPSRISQRRSKWKTWKAFSNTNGGRSLTT